MGFFTDNRIRWFISLFVYILCGAALFLPAVNIVAADNIFGAQEEISKSLVWLMSEAEFPEIYTYTLTLYFLLMLPMLITAFYKELKLWPIIFTAVVSIIFLVTNIFWAGVVAYSVKEYAFSVTPTVWGVVYILVQLGQIVNLCAFIPRIKNN